LQNLQNFTAEQTGFVILPARWRARSPWHDGSLHG